MRTMAACAALVFGASLAHAGPVPAPGLERVDRSYPSEVLRLSAMHRVKFHLKLHSVPSCDGMGSAAPIECYGQGYCTTFVRRPPSSCSWVLPYSPGANRQPEAPHERGQHALTPSV